MAILVLTDYRIITVDKDEHVGIIINRKRYHCRVCRHAFFEPVPHINEHHSMTRRLVNYITFPRLETVYHFEESL